MSGVMNLSSLVAVSNQQKIHAYSRMAVA